MTAYKTNKIKHALSRKGFELQAGRNHDLYVLIVNGKTTGVRTFFSRGISEYGNNLLGLMKKQLHLESPKELDDLICCPMSHETLVDLLNDRDVIDIH